MSGEDSVRFEFSAQINVLIWRVYQKWNPLNQFPNFLPTVLEARWMDRTNTLREAVALLPCGSDTGIICRRLSRFGKLPGDLPVSDSSALLHQKTFSPRPPVLT